MKLNDWIVATLNNPTFTVGDFLNIADMSLDNTQLLSRESYLKSNFIRLNDLFKDKDGLFSEDLFNSFYESASLEFSKFATEDVVNNYEYSIWDANRPIDSKTKEVNFGLSTIKNSEHVKIGIGGINEVTLSDKSRRELAQNSKIYDPETGTYLDKSVNDISLFSNPVEYFKSWLDEPLVYATYDEDTIETDPNTGKLIKHLKGEWKVNEDGEYYTEKLNGRSLLNKTVVSVQDYITNDNSNINKYDLFDSDGLDKSSIGIIAKNLIASIPIFIPYVGTAYSGILIAREMAKTMPMMYGIINGLSGETNVDNKLMNTMQAYGLKFTSGTSDYAQLNTFSLENFLNMASEVALQWGLLSVIANTFSKLTSGGLKAIDEATMKAGDLYLKKAQKAINDRFSGKISDSQLMQYIGTTSPGEILKIVASGMWTKSLIGKLALNKYLPAAQKVMENRIKAGLDLSLVYMALVSNTDVYLSVLEKGGTPLEAAAIALGSMIGMFSVDRYLGLGEMFFLKSSARLAIRESARHNADLYMAGRKAAEDTTTKKGIINALLKGINTGKKAVIDYFERADNGTLSLFGKSLGEGLEEVSEELVADSSKLIGELLGHLGYFSLSDYGAWDNAFDRYMMSFLGGSVGGAMFGIKHAWDTRDIKTREVQNELTYLLRLGKKDQLIQEFRKLMDQGQLGSTTLSYDPASNDTETFLTADEQHKSQAQVNYEGLVKIINLLDMILNDNGLNLSEDELFDKLVQGEYRALALSDFLKGDNIEDVKEASYISLYLNDFQKLTVAIEEVEGKILELMNNTPDPSKRSSPEFKEKLDKYLKEKLDLLDLKEYLFGEGSLGYVRKTLFAIDPVLNRNFGTFNFNQYVRYLYNKSVSELNESERAYAYELFLKLLIKLNLDEAFNLFLNMEKLINPSILDLLSMNVDKEIKHIEELRKNDPFSKLLSEDSKLDSETDEEYRSLFILNEGESEEDFLRRKQEHIDKVLKYNLDNIYKWILDFLQLPITSTDFRYLVGRIRLVKSLNLRSKLNNIQFKGDNELTLDIRSIIERIGIDDKLKLYEAIKNRILKSTESNYSKQYNNKVDLDLDKIVTNELKKVNTLTPEEKMSIGIPADYTFDSRVITNLDIYSYIQYMKANKGWDINLIMEDLDESGWVLQEDSPLALLFYSQALLDKSKLESKEANDIVSLTLDQYLIEIENSTQTRFDDFKYKLDNNFIKILENDEIYKTLTLLEKSLFINNPVIPILDLVSKQSQNKDINIEEFLLNIYETFSRGDSYQDFQLSDEQIKILNLILQDLETAAAFIYAASDDQFRSVGHNRQLNQFVNNHREVFPNYEELPEINSKISNFLLGEIAAYKREIQLWIDTHNKNSQELDIKFFKASQTLTLGIVDFFKIYRNDFKLSDNIDLLNGYENLSINNDLSSVIALQELLYNNFNNAISGGRTVESILDEIIPKIAKFEGVLAQHTAKLDENFTYSNFTDYDKFLLFISSIAASTTNYYQNLYNFLLNNLGMAPISILEYLSKLAYAQNENPELINKALEYIKQKTGTKLDIAKNTQIITGLGGTGKTFAVARLNLGLGENSWLSGPELALIDTLQKSLPKGKGISIEDLFRIVFGGDESDLSTLYTRVTNNGTKTVALKTEFKPKTILDPPKNIIIDEATHLSTVKLLILSKFCNLNNINLLLIGDPHLNGYSLNNIENIETNVLLGWRAPDLYLSLRNDNVHKYENLKLIINMIDTLANAPMTSFKDVSKKVYEQLFKNLSLKYYNKEDVSGDIVINSISSDILNKIPKDKQIGFVGTDQSVYYKQLNDAGFKIKVMSPSQVQGLEFDYVIVDLNWDFLAEESWGDTGVNMIQFLKNLYTMISRSRKATILIDNGLSKIVNNIESNYNGILSAISKSVLKFRDKRLPEIQTALQENQNKIQKTLTPKLDKLTIIVRKTQYTSRAGSVVTGLYESTVDTDGFTHIKYNGPTLAEIHFSNDDVGLSVEDIAGPEDSYNDPDNYDRVKTDIILGEIAINAITIRPDGSIFIETDNGISIEGEAAKKIYEHFFKLGLGTYTRSNKKEFIKIGGEKITLDYLDEELEPIKNNAKSNKAEFDESNKDESKDEQNIGSPIRVYSNVSYSGIDTSLDVWQNNEDSRTDLGIFIRPGDLIESGNKLKYIRNVLKLKNVFTYGIDNWERLDLDIKRKFDKDSFLNASYFIVVEDMSNYNRLIGLTEGSGLTNNDRPINNKVVKLVAKIKGSDDIEYTLSLGGLNNPDTWEKNREAIEQAIQLQIDAGVDNLEELLKYKNSLKDIISRYRDKMTTWTSKNLEIPLRNKPIFHGDTLIRNIGTSYRLENVNDTASPYRAKAPLLVESPIYAMIDDIEGVKSSVKGKAVRFISSNLLLNPSELKDLYLELKANQNMPKLVRMDVLDNLGISFKSLCQDKYTELYKVSNGNTIFTLPFESGPMAVRMYISMWNFRAGLLRFIKAYLDFLASSKLTEKQVEDLCKLDNDMYNLFKKDSEVTDEASYRKLVPTDISSKLKVIWDFNDSLASYCKEFRLGYSSEHGAYLRKLTNLDTKFYKYPDSVVGVYINPSIARQYSNVIDTIFNNIIDKIIPVNQTNKKKYITTDLSTIENWFSDIKETSKIKLEFSGMDSTEDITVNIDNMSVLHALPPILVRVGKLLSIYNYDPQGLIDYLLDNEDKRYLLKFNDTVLDWMGILKGIDNPVATEQDVEFTSLIPGVIPLKVENKIKLGIKDSRLDDMFSLMFHGMISTRIPNDFTRSDIRADYAYFKYGFFVDSLILARAKNGERQSLEYVVTNPKFYASDLVSAGTVITIDVDESNESPENNNNIKELVLLNPVIALHNTISDLLLSSGILISDAVLSKQLTIDKYLSLLLNRISNKFNNYFSGNENTPIDLLLEGVSYVNNEIVFTKFIDRPELKGHSIMNVTRGVNSIEIHLDDDTKYTVLRVAGNITFTKLSEPKDIVLLIGSIRNELKEVLTKYSDENVEDGISTLGEYSAIDELFRILDDSLGVNDNNTISPEKFNRILNLILNYISERYDEEDWYSAIISDLTNYKNRVCTNT